MNHIDQSRVRNETFLDQTFSYETSEIWMRHSFNQPFPMRHLKTEWDIVSTSPFPMRHLKSEWYVVSTSPWNLNETYFQPALFLHETFEIWMRHSFNQPFSYETFEIWMRPMLSTLLLSNLCYNYYLSSGNVLFCSQNYWNLVFLRLQENWNNSLL